MIDEPAPPDATPDPRVPMTKGQRTRYKLLVAAESVFERLGFLDARVADIAAEAEVAHGTFYTYFESKTDIFRAVLTEFLPPIYQKSNYGGGASPTPFQRVEFGNRRFLDVYRRNSRMLALLEQAATFDPEVKALRTGFRHTAEHRIRRNIMQMQEDNAVDPALDAEVAASCLVAMATHSFYTWLVMENRNYDMDRAVVTLSRLWGNALGLKPEISDRPEYRSPPTGAKTR